MTPTLPVFLAYRKADGLAHAELLFEKLSGTPLPQLAAPGAADEPPVLEVFFDQRNPPGKDFRDYNEPALAKARAFLLVVTPGAAARLDRTDWLYEEIDWWLRRHRGVAPLVIDTTGEPERWVPRTIRKQWERLQSVPFSLDDADVRHHGSFARIIDGIVKSQLNMTDEDAQRERKRCRVLQLAVSGLIVALLVTAAALVANSRLLRILRIATVTLDADGAIAEYDGDVADLEAIDEHIEQLGRLSPADLPKLQEARDKRLDEHTNALIRALVEADDHPQVTKIQSQLDVLSRYNREMARRCREAFETRVTRLRKAAERDLDRNVREAVGRGVQLMENHDSLAALPWLVRGMQLDSAEEPRRAVHLRRLSGILAASPRLEQVLWHQNELGMASDDSAPAERVIRAGSAPTPATF